MDTLNQSFLTTIVALVGVLVALIRLVGPILDQALAVWISKEAAQIKAHLPENWRKALHDAAIFGAQAAEQAGVAQLIANAADVKKRYAVAAAERWLKAQGYAVDLTLLGDAVEQVILHGLHLPAPVVSR
jgi:hypothetical protein